MNVRICLSPCDEMHVCADWTSHPKEFFGEWSLNPFGEWSLNPLHIKLSKGKIPSTGKFPQRRIEPATLWTASPNTTNELFRPLSSGTKEAPGVQRLAFEDKKQFVSGTRGLLH